MAVIGSVISTTDRSGEATNGGGWYQTTAEWVADQQGSIAVDQHTVDIYSDEYPDGLVGTTITGFTDGPAQYDNVVIRTKAGQGSKARILRFGTSGCLYIVRIPGVTLENLQFLEEERSIYFRYEECLYETIKGCYVTKGTGYTNTHAPVHFRNAAPHLTVLSTIIINKNVDPTSLIAQRCIHTEGTSLFQFRAVGSTFVNYSDVTPVIAVGGFNAAGNIGDISSSAFISNNADASFTAEYKREIANCQFSNATGTPINSTGTQTAITYDLSWSDGTDFVSPSTDDFNAQPSGILEDAGIAEPDNVYDIVGYLRGDPPESGAYEIQGAPAGPTFNGPDIVAQTGVENTLFSFDENGQGTVASRFTGATNFAYAAGSDQPAGITVNQFTGNLEGTPTVNGAFDITIEGDDGAGGSDFTNTFTLTIASDDIAPSNADANGPYTGPVSSAIAITGTFTPGTGPGAYTLWESDKPGTFADASAASTTFTPTTVDANYTLTFTAGNDVGTSSDTTNLDSQAVLTPPTNVDAGGPYQVEVNNSVNIDATYDAGTGTGLNLLWESNLPGVFGNTSLASTTFTPSQVSTGYILTFTATNSAGADSDTAPLDSQAAVVPPTGVDAGGTYGGTVSTPIQLAGSYTPGSDPSPVLTWTIEGGSAGGGTFLPNANAEDPTFTPDTVGNYTLRFSVDPDDGPAVSDTASLVSNAADIPVSFTGNIDDIVGVVGTPITPVDVSGEFSGNLTRTYAETGTNWPAGADIDPNTGIITWTPTIQESVNASTVTATDSGGNPPAESNPFSFIATVEGVPIVDAGPDVGPLEATSEVPYQLNGTVDPNGNTGLTYLWTYTNTQGRTGTFSDDTILNPTFTADSAAFYVLTLTVSSVESPDTPDSLNFEAGFTTQWANIGNQTASVGVPYSLDISTYAFSTYQPIDFTELTDAFPWNGLTLSIGESLCLIEGTPVSQDISGNIQFRATDDKAVSADSDIFVITVNPPSADNNPQIGGTDITSAAIGNTPILATWQGDTWLWTFGDWNILYHPPLRMQADDFTLYGDSPDGGTVTLDAGAASLTTDGFAEFEIPSTQLQSSVYDQVRMQISLRADSQFSLTVWQGIPEEVGSIDRGLLNPGDFLSLYANNNPTPFYLKAENDSAASRSAYVTELYVYGNDISVPFSLDAVGLRHRAVIPATTMNFADEGSEGGTFIMNATTEDGPGNNSNLGHGAIMTALESPAPLLRDAPTWVDPQQSFTVCFWSKSVVFGTGAGCQISLAGVNQNYWGMVMDCFPIPGASVEAASTGDGGTPAEGNRKTLYIKNSPDTRDQTWHHIAYRVTNHIPNLLFIDGVPIGVQNLDGGGDKIAFSDVVQQYMRFNVRNWVAGATGGNYTDGAIIADFRVYDIIKSDAEIAAIASQQA